MIDVNLKKAAQWRPLCMSGWPQGWMRVWDINDIILGRRVTINYCI